MNYIKAYEILGLDPKTASIKDVLKSRDKGTLPKVLAEKKQTAANLLIEHSPEEDGFSNNYILSEFNNNCTKTSPKWNAIYEEYHIYFENKIEKLNFQSLAFPILAITTFGEGLWIGTYPDSKPTSVFLIFASGVFSVLAYYKIKERTNNVLRIFNKQAKINLLNKRMNKSK